MALQGFKLQNFDQKLIHLIKPKKTDLYFDCTASLGREVLGLFEAILI